MKKFRFPTRLTFVLWISCALSVAMAQPNDYEQRAKQILDETGIKGGLIVQIGSGDGRLTAALGEKECYVVQALEVDAKKVQKARQYVRSLGRYGRVSVSQWDGRGLPYADGKVKQARPLSDTDWPMYRQNPRRSGSVATELGDKLERLWEAAVGENITPPVVAGSRLLVAEIGTHTVHAMDAETGRRLWRYTAGGRVDSSPTVCGSLVLFGSADGRVYCLRAADGAEVWRFMAAPQKRRISAFGQVESAWPVHGSVVVQNDVTSDPPRRLVYFTAGRSSYLDGGIYAYALDPQTGELIHQTHLSGPRPDPYKDTGGAGYMDGTKSDILVSDGGDLFLFQERFAGDLTRFPAPMQELGKERGGFRVFPPAPERGSSAKRLISTRGFLDDSYNEGTYWTFSERWPGWDRNMRNVRAYGQILSFDKDRLYGVHVFTERVRVRRGFFPGTKGYRLYARDHSAKDDKWSVLIPIRVRAMVAAGGKLFVAGPPDLVPDEDPLAAFEGRRGAMLWAFCGQDGEKLAEVKELDAPPVYDGLIATAGRLYVSLKHGRVVCFGEQDIK